MGRPIPEHFYKYASRKTAKAVLENRTLQWSSPAVLNDPFDVQFDMHLDLDKEQIKAIALPKLWSIIYEDAPFEPGNQLGHLLKLTKSKYPKMSREDFFNTRGADIDRGFQNLRDNLPAHQAAVRGVMARTKVLCFSEVPDSILMWAYYAEQQFGVVLVFRALVESDSAWLTAKPIAYSEKIPPFVDEKFLADMSAGLVSMSAVDLLERMTLTKALEWGHEREWRVTLAQGHSAELYEYFEFNANDLEAVIFGCLTSEADRAEISALIRKSYPHTKLRRAVKAAGEFKLLIEDIP